MCSCSAYGVGLVGLGFTDGAIGAGRLCVLGLFFGKIREGTDFRDGGIIILGVSGSVALEVKVAQKYGPPNIREDSHRIPFWVVVGPAENLVFQSKQQSVDESGLPHGHRSSTRVSDSR